MEKNLTPVHSLNDQSKVFSASTLASYLNMSRKDDNFHALTAAMIQQKIMEPVFQRIDSDYPGANASAYGYYSLTGYTFTDKFIESENYSYMPDIDGEDVELLMIILKDKYILPEYNSSWQANSKNEVTKFLYNGNDHTESNFLDGRKPQLLRFVGERVTSVMFMA